MTEPQVRRSLWGRLYHGETDYDFVGKFNRWLLISGVIIAIGVISLSIRGLNLGIDFEGGVVWDVPQGELSVAEAQAAVTELGAKGVSVQTLTADGKTNLRVEAEALPLDEASKISASLADLTGSSPDEVNLTSVGPSWGREISSKALRALVFFLIALTLYITFRFELKMAIPTIVALVHDILITISVYSLTGFEVTPATVVSLLTILGFSIYDGIVVFDKVDENTPLVGVTHGLTYSAMVNLSLNQVLMRSLNTSLTALLPVASLLILGGFILGATTLEEFALALLIGLFAGAYSSIFIASPLLAVLKEREGRYRDIRERLASRARATAIATPVAAVVQGEGGEVVSAAAPPVGRVSPAGVVPRPRKKTKKDKKS
jgi:preprotein translocase subunit SecF